MATSPDLNMVLFYTQNDLIRKNKFGKGDQDQEANPRTHIGKVSALSSDDIFELERVKGTSHPHNEGRSRNICASETGPLAFA